MQKSFDLYYVAVLPPADISERIYELKMECNDKYDSKSALRSPAHITLQSPFRWKGEVEPLLGTLTGFACTQKSFGLTLNNFGCFEPKVIFVDVEPNDQLTFCHFEINKLLNEFFDVKLIKYADYNPHMTIAFRDLTEENFKVAWKDFESRKFPGSFTANSIALLKHNGKFWEVEGEFGFGIIKSP